MWFNERARTWDDDPIKTERSKAFAKTIVEQVQPKPEMSALEFGCGTGLLSYQLKDDFGSFVLVDSSEGMIKVLKEKIEQDSLSHFIPLQADLLEAIPDIGPFDAIYTLMALHHIDSLPDILQVFHRLLKPGGKLCIGDLVKEDGSFHGSGFTGHKGFDKDELSKQLKEQGLEPFHHEIFYELERKRDNGSRKFPLFSLIAQK
ncbi:class I SAM-dependent methyltransferase [Prolixibacter sp. SD074]|uniref:class I SAM-dependent methyltransferase n=1 Tax=Prolixibacter sp. SD074 TaxID=2652391 RepID=UPI00128732D1|nr:class I SAM-dependent methyltransferase [Prolixibacter sp. SD074]GET28828.1 S-adenosylmethionine-dependent methyltransferase [Prolixibacter sp. SD074]